MARYEQEIEQLFDVLTDYTCTSHADIAAQAEWPEWKVGNVLAVIREPAEAQEWGWTVPHVARGRGEHLYQVVAVDQAPLGKDEQLHIRTGAASTCRITATENTNMAYALRMAADVISDPSKARALRRTVKSCEGAAAMLEDAAELLGNGIS
jgi:hypothetical protein